MRESFTIPSNGIGQLHCCRWMPEGEPKAVLQIVHGIAEYIERYDDFAGFLNGLGYVVVAEDHMGHGQTVGTEGTQGYFEGGWFTAVSDSYALLRKTKAEYPQIPYVLFGHSMGSFMARTILEVYPDSGIAAAVICGTGWQPRAILPGAIGICQLACKKVGEKNPSDTLQNMVFGGYNKRVEHSRTAFDWLTRDAKVVDAYIAHPSCGFTATTGLLRDLLTGIRFIEQKQNLAKMNKDLPVLFIAGSDDPVGNYGKGVTRAAEEFRRAGMKHVACRLFPLGRHEILNEINRREVYDFTAKWLGEQLGR